MWSIAGMSAGRHQSLHLVKTVWFPNRIMENMKITEAYTAKDTSTYLDTRIQYSRRDDKADSIWTQFQGPFKAMPAKERRASSGTVGGI